MLLTIHFLLFISTFKEIVLCNATGNHSSHLMIEHQYKIKLKSYICAELLVIISHNLFALMIT